MALCLCHTGPSPGPLGSARTIFIFGRKMSSKIAVTIYGLLKNKYVLCCHHDLLRYCRSPHPSQRHNTKIKFAWWGGPLNVNSHSERTSYTSETKKSIWHSGDPVCRIRIPLKPFLFPNSAQKHNFGV